MEVVGDLAGRAALLLGAHRDRRAVDVGAGHHQHVVAGHAVVAGEDVRRQVRAGDLANVERAVSVRPGDSKKDTFRHESILAGQSPPSIVTHVRAMS